MSPDQLPLVSRILSNNDCRLFHFPSVVRVQIRNLRNGKWPDWAKSKKLSCVTFFQIRSYILSPEKKLWHIGILIAWTLEKTFQHITQSNYCLVLIYNKLSRNAICCASQARLFH